MIKLNNQSTVYEDQEKTVGKLKGEMPIRIVNIPLY